MPDIRPARDWAHRRGIARILNTSRNNYSMRGTAYVEARGPRCVALALATGAVRHCPLARPDWDTLRLTGTERAGRGHYRFRFDYLRVRG
jgi:hypothetical protein